VSSKDIQKIEKIKLNLFELKPFEALQKTYQFYKDELSNYFSADGSPKKLFFEEINCPICKASAEVALFQLDNFEYNQCLECKSVYNKTMLKDSVLEAMYSSGIYLQYFKNLVAGSQTLRKEKLERRKVAQLSSFFEKPGKVLDVGCGSGSLLKECQEIGWEVFGVDPSDEAVFAAKNNYNLVIEKTTFEAYQTTNKFDCIVFIGLEHLQDPMGGLKKARKLLNDNGVIFFEVPSADSFIMNHLKKYPLTVSRFIEAGRHYLFFSKKSIEHICLKYDFKLEFIESNGLDLQTLLQSPINDDLTEKIIDFQDTLNDLNLGDHYRVFLRKNESKTNS
jgi:2-polyprenyl-3-methyl-5-hydroxy-6-metoxy-1,4-benzoquinol methylase